MPFARSTIQRRRWLLVRIVAALALAIAASPRLASAQVQLAVVVHPSNPTDRLTSDQLRRIFLAEAFTYPGGGHVLVAMHSASAAGFAQRVLAQRPERVKARWMAAVFAGEASAAPSQLASVEDVRKFIQEHPDAIAFLPVSAVNEDVKVLRVDGYRPGDAAYPLR